VRGVQAKYGGVAVGGAAARLVCPACGCGTRGDGGLGVGIGAEPWDRWLPRGTGVHAQSAGGAADAAQRARRRAWARVVSV
jgi:hypothetical protein